MIHAIVGSAIVDYDNRVALPRHLELKAAVDQTISGMGEIKTISSEIRGGVKVLKWLAAILMGALAAGGGLNAWMRVTGHN